MIVAIDAGEFEGQLVPLGKLAASRLVAAEQRVAARADDEFVAGIVAAAGEDRRLLGGEDVALIGARTGFLDRRRERQVAELAGLAHIFEFGLRFHHAASRSMRLVASMRVQKPSSASIDGLAVGMGEAIGVGLDAEPLARGAEARKHVLELVGGLAPAASVQMRMSSMIEVCWAWRRSGARVRSASLPSAPR